MNAELIKALRCCIVDFNSTQSRRCNECPYRIYVDGEKACENKAKRDAADALEAAEKRIAELEAKAAFFDADNLNYQENIEYRDERIKELEAQIPKEGEWVGVNPMVDTEQCSICGWNIPTYEFESNFCPNCGAKMRKGELL